MTTPDTPINALTHPELFAEMDKAASQFWAYPSLEWQDNFIETWFANNGGTVDADFE